MAPDKSEDSSQGGERSVGKEKFLSGSKGVGSTSLMQVWIPGWVKGMTGLTEEISVPFSISLSLALES